MLFYYIDLSLAGCDMLLCFVLYALLMDNNDNDPCDSTLFSSSSISKERAKK